MSQAAVRALTMLKTGVDQETDTLLKPSEAKALLAYIGNLQQLAGAVTPGPSFNEIKDGFKHGHG